MKKILVVDDDPSFLALVRAFLRDEYQVVTSPNGEAAIESVAADMPDLILTDVLMPQMTGYEFFIHLKNSPAPISQIPIIVMSARENVKYVFDTQTIVSFLPKPFTKEELYRAIGLVFSSQA